MTKQFKYVYMKMPIEIFPEEEVKIDEHVHT